MQIKALLEIEENVAFIKRHLHQDARQLLLKYAQDPDKRRLCEQIIARQKIRKKLPEYYQNLRLIMPPQLNLEQCSREEVASLKAGLLPKGKSMADLTGGMGIDFQHLSEKFEEAHYNEIDPNLKELVEHNLAILLGQKAFKTYGKAAEELIKFLPQQDLIYLDPARRDMDDRKLVALDQYQPNVLQMWPDLKAKTNQLLLKVSPMVSISAVQKEFDHLKEIWVIASRNEVREVSFLFDFSYQGAALIRCFNILADGSTEKFESEDKSELIKPELSRPLDYLFVPNTSVLKAGLMDELALKFELKKLESHTNIFTAGKDMINYPGRRFKLTKEHKSLTKELQKRRFNVLSKNHPLKASQIEQKLRLKPSDKNYLIACSSLGSKLILECELLP